MIRFTCTPSDINDEIKVVVATTWIATPFRIETTISLRSLDEFDKGLAQLLELFRTARYSPDYDLPKYSKVVNVPLEVFNLPLAQGIACALNAKGVRYPQRDRLFSKMMGDLHLAAEYGRSLRIGRNLAKAELDFYAMLLDGETDAYAPDECCSHALAFWIEREKYLGRSEPHQNPCTVLTKGNRIGLPSAADLFRDQLSSVFSQERLNCEVNRTGLARPFKRHPGLGGNEPSAQLSLEEMARIETQVFDPAGLLNHINVGDVPTSGEDVLKRQSAANFIPQFLFKGETLLKQPDPEAGTEDACRAAAQASTAEKRRIEAIKADIVAMRKELHSGKGLYLDPYAGDVKPDQTT